MHNFEGFDVVKFSYAIMIFGLYCNASAKCVDWISSLPARSAMVRASLPAPVPQAQVRMR